jgi:hypothetical protein
LFTDGPATPVRLEVLLNVLGKYSSGLKRDVIYGMLQPLPLSEGGQSTVKQNTAKDTLRAAFDLELVEGKQSVKLSKNYNKRNTSKENILRAADNKILSNCDVELHLSLFYSYYLGLNKDVYQCSELDREDWANKFNKDVNNQPQANRFNATKYTGLDRWFSYLGLGWYDSNDNFQANPYERLLRSLPDIFRNKPRLKGDDFMVQLAEVCPELDGGDVFIKANTYKSYDVAEKQCTLGLSHALVDLHEDKIIRLGCPVDSHGWNIGLAQPPRDETLNSNRIEIIEFLGN